MYLFTYYIIIYVFIKVSTKDTLNLDIKELNIYLYAISVRIVK